MAKTVWDGKDHLDWQRLFGWQGLFRDGKDHFGMTNTIWVGKDYLRWRRPFGMAKGIWDGKDHLGWQRPFGMAKTVWDGKDYLGGEYNCYHCLSQASWKITPNITA